MLRTFPGVIACCLLTCLSSPAQDRVTVQRETTLRPILIFGQILDYTGDVMTLRGVGGNSQTVEAESILSIETRYEQEHLDALAALNVNDAARPMIEINPAPELTCSFAMVTAPASEGIAMARGLALPLMMAMSPVPFGKPVPVQRTQAT